jgi:2-hydroxychromene-2-carboxylate isomerase
MRPALLPMKHISFYFDPISPYAYLAFEKLPQALMGHSYTVDYIPVVFGALLKHHGQLGPAELPGKRDWTYRQVLWQGQRHGVPLDLPASHPFNSLSLLRLAVACGQDGRVNRYGAETLLRHVWTGGAEAADPQRLQALAEQLKPARDPSSLEVKAELKANTDQAIALGIFGVPTLAVDGRLFWGFDALPMLADYLSGEPWFSGPQWDAVCQHPVGVVRSRG